MIKYALPLLLLACSKPATNPSDMPGGDAAAGNGSINGLVQDLGNGAGIVGATVTAGDKTATTDAQGYFSFTGLAAGQVTVSVSKDGFAPAFATPRASDKPESTLITLKKQGDKQSYATGAQQTLVQKTEAGPYAVIFAAGSLDTTDGNVSVSITPVDPTKESRVLPGQLVTTSSTVLFPVTFAEFSIVDSSGKRLQLKSGQTATVELPIPPPLRSQYALDAKIHCYAFNPATGQWDDFVDGTVRVSSVDGTTPVLAAAIKHFSWYGGAPEGNNCFDVVGRVVSAVDGHPLGNARVEASPGAVAYTDADGYFTVVGSGSATKFFAYQTGIDVDGSLTGMAGAKFIEYGEVSEALTGLTLKECTTTAAAGAAAPAGTKGGGRDNPVTVKVGTIGKQIYQATAILSADSITVVLQSGLPGPDGMLTSEMPASGAKIKLSGGAVSADLTELAPGTGYYAASQNVGVEKGKTYLLTIDVDGNGSIEGQGSVSLVGDLALTTPTEGGSYPAAGFTATWTDSGTGNPGYSAVYFLSVSGAAGGGFYFGSDLSIPLYNQITGLGTALPPGVYTASLAAYSGFVSATGGNISQSNNITGVGISGTAFSVGSVDAVTFTLE